MADGLEHEVFARHLHSKFRIFLNESNSLEVELETVGELLLSPLQERFAIVFRGPREPLLPQGSYKIEHDEMGEIILFLVAMDQDAESAHYEAVFNRVRKTD